MEGAKYGMSICSDAEKLPLAQVMLTEGCPVQSLFKPQARANHPALGPLVADPSGLFLGYHRQALPWLLQQQLLQGGKVHSGTQV